METNLGAFRLNPKGEYDPREQYDFLDLVTYKGSSYVSINKDIIDGVANIGILPVGEEKSPLYWALNASKGDTGPIAPHYDSFITLDSIVWDYSLSDKIIIPEDMKFEDVLGKRLVIENVYDGCCGLIITKNEEVVLPENSDYAVDFDYVTLSTTDNLGQTNQYYLYSFICREIAPNTFTLIWHRTVISNATGTKVY